jgi:hypothetical protein
VFAIADQNADRRISVGNDDIWLRVAVKVADGNHSLSRHWVIHAREKLPPWPNIGIAASKKTTNEKMKGKNRERAGCRAAGESTGAPFSSSTNSIGWHPRGL